MRIGVRPPRSCIRPAGHAKQARSVLPFGMSPISSRKSVPPSAARNVRRWRGTPVRHPFSWPEQSDSIRSQRNCPMLTRETKGPVRRSAVIMQGPGHDVLARARLHPVIITVRSVASAREGTVRFPACGRERRSGNCLSPSPSGVVHLCRRAARKFAAPRRSRPASFRSKGIWADIRKRRSSEAYESRS